MTVDDELSQRVEKTPRVRLCPSFLFLLLFIYIIKFTKKKWRVMCDVSSPDDDQRNCWK